MKYISIIVLCSLAISCGKTTEGSSSASSGAQNNYSLSDLGGSWVGRLIPVDPSKRVRLFYFTAGSAGAVANAADSVGNQWHDFDSSIVVDFLSNGELDMTLSAPIGQKKLRLQGNMARAMTSITGDYVYENFGGVAHVGSFEIHLSTGNEYFTGLDFSGAWSGGFGIGHRQNERLLTFELNESGQVTSGSLINTLTGEEIHHYSPGAGNFGIDNTANGRIDNFALVADDGSIAECDYLLVAIDLELIAGVGIDSEVGEAIIEVRR
jgi:hypothetical protein